MTPPGVACHDMSGTRQDIAAGRAEPAHRRPGPLRHGLRRPTVHARWCPRRRTAWWAGALAWAQRRPVVVLAILMAAASAPHVGHAPVSWRFFRTAGRLVRDGQLAGVYAAHPELQFGPVSFLASAVFSFLPPEVGRVAAMVCMAGLGVVTLALLHRLVPADRPDVQVMWWSGAAVVCAAWAELAVRYGHLDDALALTAAVAGLVALHRGHPYATAVLLALSVDAKPWAAPLGIMLLAAGRRRWAASAVFAVIVAAAWAPFALDGLHSLNAAGFVIPVAPGSSLTLLHAGYTHTPWWCRPAQLAVGAGLAAVAIRARSLPAAFLAVFAVRLLLDPAVHAYYDVEVLLGALACDITLTRRRVPWLTVVAAATVYAPTYLLTPFPPAHAVVRTAGLVAVAAVALTRALQTRTCRAVTGRTASSPVFFASSQ